MPIKKRIVIIGGGAAGFFTANVLGQALNKEEVEIIILEKTNKILSKVKVSGGGRCNVTNACVLPKKLAKNYPRGEKELQKLFFTFNPSHTIEWFQKRGVELKTEADNRMFPVSNSSQTIMDCFLNGASKYGVKLQKGVSIQTISKENDSWKISTETEEIIADFLVITAGSSESIWKLLKNLGHHIIPSIPSLFTFKLIDEKLKSLAGVSLPEVQVKIVGTKLAEQGAFLITHWGISGPAVLRLSAWGAISLHEKNYEFKVHINFCQPITFEQAHIELQTYKVENPKKTIVNYPLFKISQRLWFFLCERALIDDKLRWIDLSKKQFNKLLTELTQGEYEAKGKTTFKEEFVTCGGVDLQEIMLNKMESKTHSNLHFAGEILNIDAITGGYNFQAAWTTSWVLSQAIIEKITNVN